MDSHSSFGASINVSVESVPHKSRPGFPVLGHDSEFKRLKLTIGGGVEFIPPPIVDDQAREESLC